jgi:hypothetical protein
MCDTFSFREQYDVELIKLAVFILMGEIHRDLNATAINQLWFWQILTIATAIRPTTWYSAIF